MYATSLHRTIWPSFGLYSILYCLTYLMTSPHLNNGTIPFLLRFNFGAAEEDNGEVQSATSSFSTWSSETAHRVVKQLHEILKPFLLRRVKTEVEQDLPPKKEYLLYAPLSPIQANMYNRVVHGTFRDWLVAQKAQLEESEIGKLRSMSTGETQSSTGSRGRKEPTQFTAEQHKRFYDAGMSMGNPDRYVRKLKLDNTVMQLRKICCHPYLMDWPAMGDTDMLRIDQEMARTSGKMRMLDQILEALFERGHRVLIFSQVRILLI